MNEFSSNYMNNVDKPVAGARAVLTFQGQHILRDDAFNKGKAWNA